MYCYECMKEIKDGSKFCYYCGKSTQSDVQPNLLKPGTILHNQYLITKTRESISEKALSAFFGRQKASPSSITKRES